VSECVLCASLFLGFVLKVKPFGSLGGSVRGQVLEGERIERKIVVSRGGMGIRAEEKASAGRIQEWW
jgi:hypothetical protein